MSLLNGQQENKDFFYHLDVCCRLVAEKFGQPETGLWLNGDYIQLSSVLFRKTSVRISPSTLKRIFGKLKTTERYYPQRATRDALAIYAGYADWDDFINKHPRPLQKTKETELSADADTHQFPKQTEADIITPGPVGKKPTLKRYTLLSVAVALVIILIVLLTFYNNGQQENIQLPPGMAILSCSKPAGEAPHSTTFKIRLAKEAVVNPEKFTIDFGDGRKPRQLMPEQSITHYYEVPGRYYAVLNYNLHPCDTVPVYLKTKGWTATVRVEHDTTRVYPVDISRLGSSGKLEINASEIHAAGVDTNHTFFVDFANTQPIAISGDNFKLSTNIITSSSRPGVRCSQADIHVYGERTQHLAIFMKPGCVSWSYLQFSEIKHNGEMEDLSFMGTDLTSGGNVELSVVHQKASLFVNGKKIYETVYQYPLGKIFGVKISFAGLGTINDFNLKDLGTGQHFKMD